MRKQKIVSKRERLERFYPEIGRKEEAEVDWLLLLKKRTGVKNKGFDSWKGKYEK